MRGGSYTTRKFLKIKKFLYLTNLSLRTHILKSMDMRFFLHIFCLAAATALFCNTPKEVVEEQKQDPEKKWYFTFKPGYYYFTDADMRQFFDDGGFTFRAETGCKVYGPLIVWVDAGYFQKTGRAIGGTEKLELKLATITLGLKAIHYFNDWAAIFAGAGPRLFMMLLNNDSPFVRGDDNEIGIGGGFDLGLWFFPVKTWKNFYIEIFGDYSWKKLKVDEDEISSFDNDIDVSGLTAGGGIGIKF